MVTLKGLKSLFMQLTFAIPCAIISTKRWICELTPRVFVTWSANRVTTASISQTQPFVKVAFFVLKHSKRTINPRPSSSVFRHIFFVVVVKQKIKKCLKNRINKPFLTHCRPPIVISEGAPPPLNG